MEKRISRSSIYNIGKRVEVNTVCISPIVHMKNRECFASSLADPFCEK